MTGGAGCCGRRAGGRRVALLLAATDDRVSISRPANGVLQVRIRGAWALRDGIPAAEPVMQALESGAAPERLQFVAQDVGAWDSSLVTFVHSLAALATARGVAVDTSTLPQGARKLVELALAVKPRTATASAVDDAITARIGGAALCRSWARRRSPCSRSCAAGRASAAWTWCTRSRRAGWRRSGSSLSSTS
jgi:hypothetical protein